MIDLYQAQILDRSQNPRYRGSVKNPTHRAEGANLSCGDEVSWELRVKDGVIQEIRHQCRACAVCTASADLLAEQFESKPLTEALSWKTENLTDLLGIPLSPIRLKCGILPLEALKCIDQSV